MQAVRGPLLDEVLDCLESRGQVTVEDFLRTAGLPITGLQHEQRERIAAAVTTGYPHGKVLKQVPVEQLAAFTDRLRLADEQHVFLFRAIDGHQQHLPALRARLEQHERFGSDEMVWSDTGDTPELALVEPYDGGLRLKWIESRDWHQNIGTKGAPNLVRRREIRSANFLTIDFEQGRAEVRIQKLHTYPRRTVREELEIYRSLADDLFDFAKHFTLVSLEPAVRALLRRPDVDIQRWDIVIPSEGALGGDVDPKFLDLLKWNWKGVRGVAMKVTWPETGVTTGLDARSNEVTVQRSEEYARREVFDALGDVAGDPFKIPQLRSFAKENPTHRETAQDLDLQLRPDQEQTVDLREVIADWKPSDGIPPALAALIAAWPKIFRVRWHVRCPVTKKPAGRGRGDREYDSFDAVPARIDCDHARPKHATHTSARIVRARLYFTPHPWLTWPGLLALLAWLLRLTPGEATTRRLLNAAGVVLFMLIYIPSVLATQGQLLGLFERAGARNELLVKPGASLIYICFAAVLMAAMGGRFCNAVLRFLRKVTVDIVLETLPIVFQLVADPAGRWWRRRKRERQAAKRAATRGRMPKPARAN